MDAEKIAREIVSKYRASPKHLLLASFATAIRAAEARGEARGYAKCREQALRAISTLPGYSSELERAHAAIRKMEPNT